MEPARRMLRVRPTLQVLGLFVALGQLGSNAAADPLWTVSTESDIVFQRLTPLGSLLVSTENELSAIEPSTGKVLWKRPDIRKLKEHSYDEMPNAPYGLIDLGSGVGGMKRGIEILDLQTGQPRWDTMDLPLSSSLGLFEVPHKNLVMLMGAPRQGGMPVMVAADIETGRTKWQQEGLFARPLQLFQVRSSGKVFKRYSIEGNQAPIYDTDHTAILWISEDGPIKIDLDNGRRLWVANHLEGKAPPACRNGYASITLGEGVAFVPFGRKLQSIDLASGAPVWAKPRDFKARVVQMKLTPAGLVVRGGAAVNEKGKLEGKAFLDLIDPRTGASLWKKPLENLGNATPFDVQEGELFIAAEGELIGIDLASGASKTISRFKFNGNGTPYRLEVVEGGYLLSSSQNMMMVGVDGEVKYQYGASTDNDRSNAPRSLSAPSVVFLSDPYGDASAREENRRYPLVTRNHTISRRYHASQSRSEYSAVLTLVVAAGRKGTGLVKIEKSSGKETAKIVFGDKPPQYVMDRLDGRVFVVKSNRELICYDF